MIQDDTTLFQVSSSMSQQTDQTVDTQVFSKTVQVYSKYETLNQQPVDRCWSSAPTIPKWYEQQPCQVRRRCATSLRGDVENYAPFAELKAAVSLSKMIVLTCAKTKVIVLL